jgi:hypothetical protein
MVNAMHVSQGDCADLEFRASRPMGVRRRRCCVSEWYLLNDGFEPILLHFVVAANGCFGEIGMRILSSDAI